ncbi:MAG: AraC family transcriptional regulator [Burkholderiales bacterium]|nr:AraC family transcriptional regulator [Burkholderiales bacterium]
MPSIAPHQSRVFTSPWPGVYATHISSGRHYGRHSHGTYGFGLMEDGAQRSASGRGMVDAYAGNILTTNPGEVHDGRPLGGDSRRWRMVHLDVEVLAGLGGDGNVALTQPVLSDAPLRSALMRLLRRLEAWHAQAPASDALACEESLVQACALLLARHATQASTMDDDGGGVALVRARLADSLLDAPSLTELAALAGAVSKFQLLRRFSKAYGATPHAWLVQQRAERARGLIGQGAALAHAAAQSGFADQSHMTRVFVRQFGFTPGAWQQAAARGTRLQ